MDAKEKRKLHRQKMKEEGKYHNKKKKPKKKNSIFSTIVLIIAICVFCFSAFQLYQIFSSYKKGNDEYDKIKNLASLKLILTNCGTSIRTQSDGFVLKNRQELIIRLYTVIIIKSI